MVLRVSRSIETGWGGCDLTGSLANLAEGGCGGRFAANVPERRNRNVGWKRKINEAPLQSFSVLIKGVVNAGDMLLVWGVG